jgi:flagellar hook assembly protein FlgD
VHDVSGRLVETIVDERLSAGVHTYRWNGMNSAGEEVASGIYFARLKAGARTATEKLVIAR